MLKRAFRATVAAFALIASVARAQEEYVVPPTVCYARTDFALTTSDGGDAVVLAGAFVAPRGGGRRPTVLMITGSGGHLRDQYISGSPMFGLIADELARRGFNVVLTDARGYGGSTINGAVLPDEDWMSVNTEARYRDNLKLIAMLLARPDVDPNGLIVLGHSEGAMIAARLAADRPEVDLTVLLSDSAAPGAEVFARQRADFMIARGGPPEVAERVHDVLLDYAAFLGTSPDDDAGFEAIASRFLDAQSSLPEPFFGRNFLSFFRRSLWHRYFVSYDPHQDLTRLRSPVLAIYGGADDMTPWRLHLPVLARTLSESGNADTEFVVLPDQDHFFLEFEGRRVDEHPYGQMRLSNELVDVLDASLARRFGARERCRR